MRLLALVPLAALTLAAAPVSDDLPPIKPPLGKEQERERFHPRRTGMDAEARQQGYLRRLEMERASPLAAIRFRSIGPEVQGGRIVAIQAPANQPDSLIVAFASGGLWRTDTRGGSWTPLWDGESSITIGDFALGDPDGKVIYLGTGENNAQRTGLQGTGVFKTTDGGRTWTHLGLAATFHIGRVLVDPRSPDVVYVAAAGHQYTENPERGVYKSEDGGRSWTRTLFVDERTGAIDLVQDPKRPDVLYAATWERARTAGNFLESGPGSGIWKSLDAGRTWTRLSGGFPQGATVGRIGLALAASRPETLYASLDNQARRDREPDEEAPPGELTARRLRRLDAQAFSRLPDDVVERFLKAYDFPKQLKPRKLKREVKQGRITIGDLVGRIQEANPEVFRNEVVGAEVYRSDDAGATWRRTHERPLDKLFYYYGYYFSRIAVDPTDPERVYLKGLAIVASSDGGKTWKGLDARDVHVDHHALFVDPKSPNRLALGNDGGLNLSFDKGQTWTRVNNLPVGQFTTLALDDAKPYNVLGGLQDNGVMRGPSTYRPGKDDPRAWKEIYGGDGSCVAVGPKEPSLVYAASQFGFVSRLDLKGGERTSIRPRADLTAEKKEQPLRYNWVTPFILSPHSRNVLYLGTNRLYRSLDRGDTWTAISKDLTTNPEQGDVPFGTITSVSESPKTFGLIYAGTDEGRVWVTRDGGAQWTDASAGLAASRWVTRVLASGFDEGTVYVTQSGYRDDDFAAYMWRSRDYGKTWESLAAGLPAEPVNTVREDPKAKHLLYLGTDRGVFVSVDAGKSWVALQSGLPRVPVHDLLVHPREGDLVLATHGRSVYVADASPLRKLTAEAMEKPLVAFPVKTAESGRRVGYGEHPWITWRHEEPLARIAWWAKASGTATLTVKDDAGSAWQELSQEARAGMNVLEYHLLADPKKADAAEAVTRAKAIEKEKDKGGKPSAAEAKADEDDGEEEEADDAAKPKAGGGAAKPLDADLYQALADPLRVSRKRYLPPGKYTLEIAQGGQVAKTTLTVKRPKKEDEEDEDRP